MKRGIAAAFPLACLFLFTVAMSGCDRSGEGVRFVRGGGNTAQAATLRLGGEPEEKKPLPRRYAKVALSKDESAVLSVIYEASDGTASGYDTICADFGSFESLENTQKLKAKVQRQSNVTCRFDPLALDPPGGQNPDVTSSTFSVRFCTCRSAQSETFCVFTDTTMQQSATEWKYASSGRVQPSETAEKAPVLALFGAPDLTIATKPDEKNKGQLGIALNLAVGKGSVDCKKNGQAPDAQVQIKTPEGKVVHTATEKIDKFAFG